MKRIFSITIMAAAFTAFALTSCKGNSTAATRTDNTAATEETNSEATAQTDDTNQTQEALVAGKAYADFTIEFGNLNGTTASLSDYVGHGKYVVVDFWASWCGPCRGEIPYLKAVYEKFGGKDFTVVSVAVWDKREDSVNAIKEHGMTWPQIVDAQKIPTNLYGIEGIPSIILIGPDGIILATDLRGKAIEAEVAKYVSPTK